jgi:hypothetical protein
MLQETRLKSQGDDYTQDDRVVFGQTSTGTFVFPASSLGGAGTYHVDILFELDTLARRNSSDTYDGAKTVLTLGPHVVVVTTLDGSHSMCERLDNANPYDRNRRQLQPPGGAAAMASERSMSQRSRRAAPTTGLRGSTSVCTSEPQTIACETRLVANPNATKNGSNVFFGVLEHGQVQVASGEEVFVEVTAESLVLLDPGSKEDDDFEAVLEGKVTMEVIMYQTEGTPTSALGGGGDADVTVGLPGGVVVHRLRHEVSEPYDYMQKDRTLFGTASKTMFFFTGLAAGSYYTDIRFTVETEASLSDADGDEVFSAKVNIGNHVVVVTVLDPLEDCEVSASTIGHDAVTCGVTGTTAVQCSAGYHASGTPGVNLTCTLCSCEYGVVSGCEGMDASVNTTTTFDCTSGSATSIAARLVTVVAIAVALVW